MSYRTKKEITRYLVLRTLGNFFILATIFGFLATFGPALYFEGRFRVAQASGMEFQVSQNQVQTAPSVEQAQVTPQAAPPENFLGAVLSEDKTQALSVKDPHFSIIIPKIGASEKVIENVDPGNDAAYKDALAHGVAHARGSAFPGMNGTTYIFAHSADSFWNVGRYNAVFYLLKEVEPGDDITVVYNGTRHNYVVTEKKIVDPSEVSYLEANIGKGEQLVLQTCWPPGTTFKRLLVFAKPKS